MNTAADWCAALGVVEPVDERARMRSQWATCGAIVAAADAFGPVAFGPFPPLLEHITPRDLVEHSQRALTEGLHTSKTIVRTFGFWRSHVTEVEAINQRRLQILAVALHQLSDLLRRSTQPDVVSARIGELGEAIERAWKISIPLSGDVRAWSFRVTRRYDLLPVEFRFVSQGG